MGCGGADQVFSGKCCCGMGTAFVVGKLELDAAEGKNRDNPSHLAPHQTALRRIPQQINLSKRSELSHCFSRHASRATAYSPLPPP